MKIKKLLAGFLLFSAMTASAQNYGNVVYLKNGSVVKGEITEQEPGKSVTLKTKDGNTFVFQTSEISKIANEKAVGSTVGEKGHRGLDFSVETGYDIATKGGGGSIAAELGLGKRFSKNLYWGLGAGVNIPTGDADLSIPVTTSLKAFFPLRSSKITPFAALKTGYVFNTADDITVGKGKNKVTVEQSDFIELQVMPGIQFSISDCVDLNLAAGYTHYIPVKGGDGQGAISIRAGFDIHKSLNRAKKQKVPTRDNGFELTLEMQTMNPWNIANIDSEYSTSGGSSDDKMGTAGIGVLLGYKYSKNISFGLGYSVGYANTGVGYSEYGYNESMSSGLETLDGMLHKFFVRGQYRLNDKKLSPFASVDLGLSCYKWDDEVSSNVNACENMKTSSFFVTPAVGLSLRTTNNSYFNVKAGYELGGKVKADNAEGARYVLNSLNNSGLSVSIGWTHTFNFLSNIF